METNSINIHGEDIRLVTEDGKPKVMLKDVAKYVQLDPLSDNSNLLKVFDLLIAEKYDEACKYVSYIGDFTISSVRPRMIRLLTIATGIQLIYLPSIEEKEELLKTTIKLISGINGKGTDFSKEQIISLIKFDVDLDD